MHERTHLVRMHVHCILRANAKLEEYKIVLDTIREMIPPGLEVRTVPLKKDSRCDVRFR